MNDLDKLRYPVGPQPRHSAPIDADARAELLAVFEKTPATIRALVEGLSDAELDTPYRPGGWTIRQVVHHIPDSHLNAYVRMKLAVTEETPRVKTTANAYAQKARVISSIAVSMVLAIFGAAVTLTVAPWCNVFHHLTEK